MWQCFVSKKETAGRKIPYLSVFEYLIKINVCWKEKLLHIDGDDRPTSTTVVHGLSLPAQPPLVEQVDEL